MPDGKPVELLAGEPAIAVVIERAQGLVAVVPEHPEGDIAEHLNGGCDFPLSSGINHQPAGIFGDPGPLVLEAGAIGVKSYAGGCIDKVFSTKAVTEGNGDGRDRPGHHAHFFNPILKDADLCIVLAGVEEGNEVTGRLGGDRMPAEPGALEVLLLLPRLADARLLFLACPPPFVCLIN